MLTMVHEHGQAISKLPRPSDVPCEHIRGSDDADNACAKIGRKVSTACCAHPCYPPRFSRSALASCRSAVSKPSLSLPSTALQRAALPQMAWDHVASALDGRASAFALHA